MKSVLLTSGKQEMPRGGLPLAGLPGIKFPFQRPEWPHGKRVGPPPWQLHLTPEVRSFSLPSSQETWCSVA